MNYDNIAKMNVDQLRGYVRSIRHEYIRVTGERITAKDIGKMPKTRLLYIACRMEAESDVRLHEHREKKGATYTWQITIPSMTLAITRKSKSPSGV